MSMMSVKFSKGPQTHTRLIVHSDSNTWKAWTAMMAPCKWISPCNTLHFIARFRSIRPKTKRVNPFRTGQEVSSWCRLFRAFCLFRSRMLNIAFSVWYNYNFISPYLPQNVVRFTFNNACRGVDIQFFNPRRAEKERRMRACKSIIMRSNDLDFGTRTVQPSKRIFWLVTKHHWTLPCLKEIWESLHRCSFIKLKESRMRERENSKFFRKAI